MKTNRKLACQTAFFLAACLLISGWNLAFANPPQTQKELIEDGSDQDLNALARRVISPDTALAQNAIKALRAAGPHGMRVLVEEQEELLNRSLKLSPQVRAGHPEWKRLKAALDQVGAQCDNWASKLYWFTDLEKAKAEAQRRHKPILSLRLLGNLNDELSCANSRFFRTALYPNKQINARLQNSFVLHWQSVRPVPKVTIDFGDGRKIQTTITGNSIHYVLDEEGRVLDALPGLYGPGAFLKWLDDMTRSVIDRDSRDMDFINVSRQYHTTRLETNTSNWKVDIARLKMPGEFNIPAGTSVSVGSIIRQPDAPNNAETTVQALKRPLNNAVAETEIALLEEQTVTVRTTARDANRRAVAKAAMVESRLLKEITIPLPRDRNALKRTTTDELWTKIAALHQADSQLDENSLQVLKAKTLNADKAAFNFQKSIAEDTVRNEYSNHATIHQWLIENPNIALDALNKKVYAELFLAPDSDPWLGLLPADAYTAIQNDGVTTTHQ